jgi:hypothetical protein
MDAGTGVNNTLFNLLRSPALKANINPSLLAALFHIVSASYSDNGVVFPRKRKENVCHFPNITAGIFLLPPGDKKRTDCTQSFLP